MNLVATMPIRPYHTRHRRQHFLVRRVLVLVLILVVLLGTVLALRAQADAPEQVPVSYVVRSGDTLWTITQRYTRVERDPRDLVDRVMQYNNLSTPALMPGQKLYLPAALFAETVRGEVTSRAAH